MSCFRRGVDNRSLADPTKYFTKYMKNIKEQINVDKKPTHGLEHPLPSLSAVSDQAASGHYCAAVFSTCESRYAIFTY